MARYAILIASSQFSDESNLEDLRFPENDVKGLDEILSSEDYGHFTETFVFDNKPHYEILLKINQTLRQAEKNDLVLIYYSGHGKLNLSAHLHLATANTIASALEATSIPVDSIKSYMDISPSRKKVLILDCCYSGAVGRIFAKGGVDDQLQMISKGQGTCIMTASTEIQVAVEKESDQYGVFTKHIIEGIRTGDADLNRDGWITTDELYRYVHEHVREEGCQEPMKWDFNVRGELVIAKSGRFSDQEEKIRNIRNILFDLAKKKFFPDKFLAHALDVISGEITDKRYGRLLDRVSDNRMEPWEFITEWHRLSESEKMKESPRLRKPEKAEPDKPGVRDESTAGTVKEAPEPVTKKTEATQDKERITNSIGMEFVLIQSGTFMMGSPEDELERFNNEVLHQVTLTKSFYMQTTPVTQGQWKAVMGNNPSHFKSGNDYPVENVAWNNIQEFIKKLNQKEGAIYRLPSEAEWEYSCRAGTDTPFLFGHCLSTDQANYNGNYPLKGCPKGEYRKNTTPVASFQANTWGLYDMHGNVWEWCQDSCDSEIDKGVITDTYKDGVTDPVNTKGSDRVIRGGSWGFNAQYCRSAVRNFHAPASRFFILGFRLSKDVEP